MDSEKINQLIKLLDEHQLSEIEFREGEQSIRIKRQLTLPSAAYAVQPHSPSTILVPEVGSPVSKELVSGHAILSPMVGTVYLAPGPGAAPFVELGQAVKVGDVLCIVEAMKLMNNIESDRAGTIKARCVKNGTPVAYGDRLFIVG